MKFYDYWAEYLHYTFDFPLSHKVLCRLGLHWWGWMGEINCWPAGVRELWLCSRCDAEKWVKKG